MWDEPETIRLDEGTTEGYYRRHGLYLRYIGSARAVYEKLEWHKEQEIIK